MPPCTPPSPGNTAYRNPSFSLTSNTQRNTCAMIPTPSDRRSCKHCSRSSSSDTARLCTSTSQHNSEKESTCTPAGHCQHSSNNTSLRVEPCRLCSGRCTYPRDRPFQILRPKNETVSDERRLRTPKNPYTAFHCSAGEHSRLILKDRPRCTTNTMSTNDRPQKDTYRSNTCSAWNDRGNDPCCPH